MHPPFRQPTLTLHTYYFAPLPVVLSFSTMRNRSRTLSFVLVDDLTCTVAAHHRPMTVACWPRHIMAHHDIRHPRSATLCATPGQRKPLHTPVRRLCHLRLRHILHLKCAALLLLRSTLWCLTAKASSLNLPSGQEDGDSSPDHCSTSLWEKAPHSTVNLFNFNILSRSNTLSEGCFPPLWLEWIGGASFGITLSDCSASCGRGWSESVYFLLTSSQRRGKTCFWRWVLVFKLSSKTFF